MEFFYIPKFRKGGMENVILKYISNIPRITVITDKKGISEISSRVSHDNIHFLDSGNTRITKITRIFYLILINKINKIHVWQWDALRPFIYIFCFLRINYIKPTIIYHERTKKLYENETLLSRFELSIAKKIVNIATANSNDQIERIKSAGFKKFLRLHNTIIRNKKYRQSPPRNKIA